ncbi:MAG: cupin domain-containing protein [Cytophagales bacterium]|nr:cupin domain-containing protein [Cytophagales bacterium]
MKNILHAGEGEHLFVLTDLVTIKISAKDTASQYSVIQETVPPQAGPPPHQHAEVEIFYIMEGAFEFLLEDLHNPVRVESGGVVHVPSQAVHTFKNVGATAGKLLVTLLPGNFEQFFRAVGTPVDEASVPDLNRPADPALVDVPALLAAAPAYGLRFV